MVSFDLDMTLLDHSTWQIPESALRAIEGLRGRHRIVIATGRDMDSRHSAEFIGLIRPDAIVHMNGTKVTAGGELLYEHRMGAELLCQLLEFCDRMGYSIGATLGDEDYFTNRQVVEDHDRKVWGGFRRNFKDPYELLNCPVRTLAFVGDEEQAKRVERQFPGLRLPLFAGRCGADVIEAGFSKAEGLRRLARYFGEPEDLSTCIAFGDSMNDYEVVMESGTGVAMGNAVEELKRVADYVTTPIGEDGILLACLALRLLEEEK